MFRGNKSGSLCMLGADPESPREVATGSLEMEAGPLLRQTPGLLLVFETVPSSLSRGALWVDDRLSREGGRCLDLQVTRGRFRRGDGPGLPILVSALHPPYGSGCFWSGQLLGLTVASSSSSTSKEISELQAGRRIALTFNLLVILRLFDLSSSLRPGL